MPPIRPPNPLGSLPKANAKPTKYQQIAQIEKFVRTFATTVPAFFWREKPISRNMKPACMNITTMPATMTHIELKPTESGRTPLLAASSVSAEATPGSASTVSSPTPSAGSSFCAVVRLMRPPRFGPAVIEAHGLRTAAAGLCPVVERSGGAVRPAD